MDIQLLQRTPFFKNGKVIFLSIISLFMYPVYLYWNARARAEALFEKVEDVRQATDVFVTGSRESSHEIVGLDSDTLTFEYRFLKYIYHKESNSFLPVTFKMPNIERI